LHLRHTCVIFLTMLGAAYAQGPKIGNCPVLPADNIWNTPVDTLPVAANSAAYINRMGSTLPLRPDFGSGLYNGGLFGMPFITVPGTQTKYPATFRYYDESDPGPYAIPMNVPIEGGSNSTGDRHAITIDRDNCILYELFSAYPQGSSWAAGSGAIYDLRSNALRPNSWTSADAAGLPIMPGLVRYDEIVAGEVTHALRVVATYTQRAYVWPARHYASSITDPSYPPMGTRLRLRANFDVTPYPRELQVILRGLKKYGMIIADNGLSWFFGGEPDPRWDNDMLRLLLNVKGSDFEAVDVSSLMISPDSGQAKQTGTAVTVTPASATTVTQGTQQFTANQSVTWLVNGVAGGNSQVGYVDSNGMYSAPGSVPSPATVQLQAKGASGVASASITIQCPAPVISSVTPSSITTGAFTLTVNGTGFLSGAVVKLNGAAVPTTFNSSAQLTAAGSTTTAGSSIPVSVSNTDAQVSNSMNISVAANTPAPSPVAITAITLTPGTASIRKGGSIQYVARVTNTSDTRVIWKVNGVVGGNSSLGVISATGVYTAPPRSLSVLTITATSAADPSKTATGYLRVL
jgi:hypothetical protein